MEKRVFLAIFLSFAVLALYQAYFAPKPTPTAGQAPAQVSGPSTSGQPIAGQSAEAPSLVKPAANTAAPVVADTSARDIVVDTDVVSAVFSTRGGVAKSWKLKKYFQAQTDEELRTHAAPQLLDLVPQQIPETYARPFTLATDDAATSATLASALFQPSVTSLSLGASEGTLSFAYQDASGLNARKTFLFQPDGKPYVVKVDASVDIQGKPQPVTLVWGPALGPGYNADGSREVPRRAIHLRDGKVERLTSSNLEKQAGYEGALQFAGVEDQYFLTVEDQYRVSPAPASAILKVAYQSISIPVPNDAQNRMRTFIGYSVRTPGAASLPFYVGPKDLDALRAVDAELTQAIDFGMFRFLVVPLLQSLKWINAYLGNYGWSIIALTIFINLLIFPLRHRSMVSMRKMQALQPEVKVIQERFAKYKITDPERQKMNQEMMALYKQRGVNPASGCVPMLLTMPVLFAFYSMLSGSIELRGAPFFGWLHDLSLKDPYYITPFLMGGTMFWQQRMMPSTADPMQQKMFMLMPVIFTTMFLAAPSGLVVYWLVSNLLAIGQQYITSRLIAAPARPLRLPGSRGTKPPGNNGGAKT
jgi:YidC/Oxa1 family membrane protein insertase